MELKPGYKQTEVGVIPEDWEVCPVGQKGEVVTGKALAVNGPGKQRPYLRTKNVFDGRIDINDVLTMPMTDEQFAHFKLRRGDVLLNEGQSLELVGRCAMYQDEYPEPCAIQNQLLRFRAKDGVSGVFASYLFRYCQQTGVFARIALQTTSIAHLGGSRFERLLLAWPKSEVEQSAIAEALSDVDGLLDGLDRLIAKKRDLKQAAMQQLLTGQTRLPGFRGGWMEKRLGDSCEVITKGTTPTSIGRNFSESGVNFLKAESFSESGDLLPDKIAFIDSTTHKLLKRSQLKDGDLLISIAGVLGRVGHFTKEYLPANTNQALAIIRLGSSSKLEQNFLFYCLCSPMTMKQINDVNVQAAQANISLQNVRDLVVYVPPTHAEQAAIASVLSDMDDEIAVLERRREKTRALKQAMMQELLTGRIRLCEPKGLKAKHSKQFEDAVIISVLTSMFGSKEFPIGRLRYTKLSYLFHRKAEHSTQDYLKKAAGPYNPKTRYAGAEKIAIANRYISKHKSGQYSGFVAAAESEKARNYFVKWFGENALRWLEQFRRRKKDDLELLTTVDMAMQELRKAGKQVSVAMVKQLLASEPEWAPKLKREVFSESNISAAIRWSNELFGP